MERQTVTPSFQEYAARATAAERAWITAQLPADVRTVIASIENAEGRNAILDDVGNVLRMPDGVEQVMLTGALLYARRIGHLTSDGYGVLSRYAHAIVSGRPVERAAQA